MPEQTTDLITTKELREYAAEKAKEHFEEFLSLEYKRIQTKIQKGKITTTGSSGVAVKRFVGDEEIAAWHEIDGKLVGRVLKLEVLTYNVDVRALSEKESEDYFMVDGNEEAGSVGT